MRLIKLAPKHPTLGLYFCTALFCHVAVFSSLYHWSHKQSAGATHARSIATYFVRIEQPSSGDPSQEAQDDSSSWKPTSGSPSQEAQDDKHLQDDKRSQDDRRDPAAKHQGCSTLLATLHRSIEQHQIYPSTALRSQQSGTAIVDFSLSPDGKIQECSLRKSSGYPDLDQAALQAVQAISPFKAITIHTQQEFEVAVSFSVAKRI